MRPYLAKFSMHNIDVSLGFVLEKSVIGNKPICCSAVFLTQSAPLSPSCEIFARVRLQGSRDHPQNMDISIFFHNLFISVAG